MEHHRTETGQVVVVCGGGVAGMECALGLSMAGKTVTVIKGFTGSDDDLRSLSRELKKRLCTGGAEKDGQILIQGDVRQRLLPLLRTLGYTDSK